MKELKEALILSFKILGLPMLASLLIIGSAYLVYDMEEKQLEKCTQEHNLTYCIERRNK